MTWGILRARLLLPEQADEWPAEQRQSVLHHELAHVVRRDCLVQLLAQAVLAQIRPAAVRPEVVPSKPRRLLSIAAGLSGLAAALLVLLWPRTDLQRENRLAVNESDFRYTAVDAPAPMAGESALPFSTADAAGGAAAAPPPPSPSAPGTAAMEASIDSSLAEIASDGLRC